jgi:hypothetical protein
MRYRICRKRVVTTLEFFDVEASDVDHALGAVGINAAPPIPGTTRTELVSDRSE